MNGPALPRGVAIALACCLALAAHAADAAADDKPKCVYGQVAELPIRYVGIGMAPAVDAVIDGSPATMLVDTGAYDTQMTMNGVTRHGLRIFSTGQFGRGVGGSTRLYTTRLKEFSIGPARSANRTDLLVIGADGITPAFDGIAGAPFLLQMDLELDLRAKRLRMLRPHDCGDTPLLLWKEDTQRVAFLPHFGQSPNPHFAVAVNGKELDAVIDTGAHHTVMTLEAAGRAGIDVQGPDARRLGEVVGVGRGRAPLWAARTRTVEIGAEVVNNAELGVIESQGGSPAEILLGQDFLRAHRVLFAMSQQKLYFAYLGGEVFTRSDGVPDWVRAEAAGGNPDAQYLLASAYASGHGVTRDPAQAGAWLDKAVAAGEPHANFMAGRRLLLSGRAAEAIPKLRSALDQLPADRIGPLWLYLARVRDGQAALAQSELQANLDKQREDDWPRPLADFYLGKLDAEHLRAQAAADPALAHARTCMADGYVAEWQAAHGRQAQAEALKATLRVQCSAPPTDPSLPAAKP